MPGLDRLAWYAARARAMNPAEIAWRIGSGVSIATPLTRRRGSRRVLAPEVGGWDAALDRFRAGTGRPVLLGDRAAAAADAYPAEAGSVIAAANAVLDGRFGFFGQAPVRFPDGVVDWNLDPRTGHHWPPVPAARLDHRAQHADPKWIWELNRLQHLPWLAQAWLFTGDSRYAEGALRQLDRWLEQNPVGQGIAWRGAFEAGIRAISVAVALQGMRDAAELTTGRFRRIVTMLAASAELAWQQRSRFSSANNHLVGELAGVAVVALLLPDLDAAPRLEAVALRGLAAEAGRQILPDGAGAEQSTAYQMFCAELLLVPAALLRLRGDSVPVPITSALERSTGYLRALVAGGEPLPRYGDDDGGFALRLSPHPVAALSRHLAAVETMLEPTSVPPRDLASAWLAPAWPIGGPAGTIGALTAAPQADATAGGAGDLYARNGGLVVLRRGRRRITFDAGPLGYLSIAAHGHADALAVTVTVEGEEVIGDPGTGGYYAEPTWRNTFRGTVMHPTASVDDADQSVAGGPFLWVRHAVTTVRTVDLERGVVEAEHDGYTRFAEPVVHRRYLVAPPDWETVLVVDLFTGSGTHRVTDPPGLLGQVGRLGARDREGW
jgi:hypothetical protein